MRKINCSGIVAGLILFCAGLLQAQLIDVDFNNDSFGSSHGGPAVGPTMSGAAVIGNDGDIWNGIAADNGTGIPLNYSDGSASPVTMSFTSGGSYDVYAFSGYSDFNGTAYGPLTEDYLFSGDNTQSITLSGLATNASYNLVLYNAADTAATGRETIFTVNGASQYSVWGGNDSTLIAGVDYVNFPSAMSDSSGNLVIYYSGDPGAEGDVDGFQIQLNAPVLTVGITSPANGNVYTPPTTVAITANAVFNQGSVASVQFFVNSNLLGTALTPPFSVTASNLLAGDYALTAIASADGILATSAVVNISVITYQTNESSAYDWTTLAGRAATGSVDGIGGAVEFAGPAGVALDANGNLYVTDSGNNIIRKITPGGVSSTIAGFPGESGTNDGAGAVARFYNPRGIARDNLGNLFVADTYNHRIREITRVGTNWIVTTIAGTGSIFEGNCDSCPRSGGYVDGPGTNAQFDLPMGIAVDGAENVYVADEVNSVIRLLTPAGGGDWNVSTLSTSAQFEYPEGVALDSSTNMYVADTDHSEIWKLVPSGTTWSGSVLAGTSTAFGTNDGTGSAARFFEPVGIAVGPGGVVFVSDAVAETIRTVNSLGTVQTLAGSPYQSGSADGTRSAARFSGVAGLVVNAASTVFVADNEQIRSISSGGVVQTPVGEDVVAGGANGTGSTARFDYPASIVTDTNGNIYVADAGNDTIRMITSAGVVSTIAGSPGSNGTNDGTGSDARFSGPGGLAINTGGTLYVADTGNHTIRQVFSSGVVNTICGTPGIPGSADGTGSTAQFYYPGGIAVDSSGRVYVADTRNNTIRRVTSRSRFVPPGKFITTWTVTTIAGSAHNPLGDVDGTGSAAWFDNPQGITVDPSGNIYVADTDDQVIRKITPVGTNWVVTTIAGNNLGGFADGVGTNASFSGPASIAIDSSGSLYVTDQYGNTIRKLTPVNNNWIVSTVGGLAGVYASQDGAGAAARFNQPDGITVDSAGNIYVSDADNNTIRKGVFTAFGLANLVPSVPPVLNAALAVMLNPPEAGGQWRFPWEVAWRTSGQAATGLVAGNYQVEFRAVPGWLPIPPTINVAVAGGITTQVTNQYYPTTTTVDTNLGGTLIVNLGANPPPGAGWRFLGDTTPYFPSGFSTNLLPGTYLIEFAAASGRGNPPNLSVQVQAGQTTVIDEDYPLASAPPEFAVLPELVPEGELNDLKDYPFGFNGQLQTDIGYGSGVAVETNTVLTAAHLVFNDQTLSYVNEAYWYLQREAGASDPTPQQARGWYILSGYASQRTNDLQIYAPDTSTPQSRNLDVAALYFPSPVAGGGFGGYLPSDQSPNPWLTGSASKMLVGYPVDGSVFGDASIAANAGQMYQTEPQPLAFAISSDPVANQEVYTASWMFSYPGNSGGPLYVQYNNYYYPAAVYLGTLFNNSTPIASVVRAIDSNVVNLITLASLLGDYGIPVDGGIIGTNNGVAIIIGTNNGGGVIKVTAGANITDIPGNVEVKIAPPAAAQAGGAWKFSNLPDSDYSTKNPSVLQVTSSNAQQVVFRPVPGWNSPSNQSVNAVPGTVTQMTNFYTLIASWSNPGAFKYGFPLGSNELNASIPALTNGASGTYTYTPPFGTILTVGTHTLAVTFTPNDTVNYGSAPATAFVSQIVLPEPLTVTAGNSSVVYGQPLPAFTGTMVGLRNEDIIAASYNCAATAGSPPGNYPITPALIDPNNLETNYAVTLVPGTLTITLPVVPVIQAAVQSAGGSLTFTWSAGPNQNYQIQTTTDVAQNNWTVLTTGNTGDGSPVTTSETIGTTGKQFFRVVLVP